MAHHTGRSSYQQLVGRLNRFPQGAPPSDVLYGILEMLFSEREAGLVALLPIKPFSVEKAARIWKLDPSDAQRVLDELAGRAILLDVMDAEGQQRYMLPPPMAGFFEFSMMGQDWRLYETRTCLDPGTCSAVWLRPPGLYTLSPAADT